MEKNEKDKSSPKKRAILNQVSWDGTYGTDLFSQWPEVKHRYTEFCDQSLAKPGVACSAEVGPNLYIVHMFTQDQNITKYAPLVDCLRAVAQNCRNWDIFVLPEFLGEDDVIKALVTELLPDAITDVPPEICLSQNAII